MSQGKAKTNTRILQVPVDPSSLNIEDIDLQLDGDQLSTTFTWTDKDGNTQVATDTTPVTISADGLKCLLPAGDFEPIIAATGTLSNGTTFTTGALTVPLDYSIDEAGDIRSNSGQPMRVDFSQPVDVVVKGPIEDPDLNSPTVWSYQSAPGIFPDRLATDGEIVFTPGADTPADITVGPFSGAFNIGGQITDAVNMVISNATAGNGVSSTSDWGTITIKGATFFEYQDRNNGAVNMTVRGLEEVTVCDAVAGLLEAGNIYSADGTLSGRRTLDGDGNTLTFDNLREFEVGSRVAFGDIGGSQLSAVPSDKFEGAADYAGAEVFATLNRLNATDDPRAGFIVDNPDDEQFSAVLSRLGFEMRGDGVNNYELSWRNVDGMTIDGVAAVQGQTIGFDATGKPILEVPAAAADLDYCEINEIIHNYRPWTLSLALEGTQSHNSVVNVNGVGATFDSLVSASAGNTGNGLVTLITNAAGNSNFNHRASTIEEIIDPGEYIEIAAANVGQFNTLALQMVDVKAFPANSAGGLRLFLNGAANSWTLFNGGAQIGTGQSEQAVFRFTKTAYGFRVTRNGAQIFNSPEVCNVYGENEISADANNIIEERADGLYVPVTTIASVSALTGVFVIGDHTALPLGTNIVTNTPIATGFDFTQASGMTWKVWVRDQSTDRAWDAIEIDVDNMLERFAAGDATDAFGHVFDNSFVTFNVVDAATGDITISESNRDLEYARSELITRAVQVPTASAYPIHADEAAALAAGLLTDDLYKTPTGEVRYKL